MSDQASTSEVVGSSKPRLFGLLGPGLITGASDDDPSGIATYSQAGATFGTALGWTMVLTYPLMSAVQEISARLGRTTGQGIAGNLRRHYPPLVLHALVFLLVVANVINIGADLGAMGDAVGLLLPGPTHLYVIAFGALCILLQVFLEYGRYVRLLKWLTIALFAYPATLLLVHISWQKVLHDLVVPNLQWDRAYLSLIVAIFGTTISPYLFFWQSSQEAEDIRTRPYRHPLVSAPSEGRAALHRIRIGTLVGMLFSNLVALAILLTAAATLQGGDAPIQTSAEAAAALKPVAGRFAYFLFTLGIVGTGLLAVPVLAGSAAYALGEARSWPTGLGRRPREAKAFYATIAAATALGVALDFSPIDPISALLWSATINGIVAVPIMAIMLAMARRRSIMGEFTIGPWLSALGLAATVLMGGAALAFVGAAITS